VPGAVPPAGTVFRDAHGAVARQAARFRIYGYDVNGKVVGEITSSDATIDWRVHLANRKAAWYKFTRALDIPEATSTTRRNSAVRGSARNDLVLDAGLHSTSEGTPLELSATAMGVNLFLGELLTDPDGRLVVLPGHGAARAWTGGPVYTFANNDGWLDDIADGPVSARVTIGSRVLEAESAWVISAPPNFAPGIATGWRTLHDLLEDTWVSAGLAGRGNRVSFRRHILPMFVRLARLQWVNAGILRDHGWKSPEDLSDPVLLAHLADASDGNRPFRKAWANRFRNIDRGELAPNKLPPILGDAAGISASPRQRIGTTALQRYRLHKWVLGEFLSDGITEPPVVASVDRLPLGKRPGSLDRAALDACLGDAFVPGCEITWPMRHGIMWRAPYRLKVRRGAEPPNGSQLTPAEAVAANGPLAGNFPGSVTRWMAIPWMTDTVDCRSGYHPSVDRYLDTFWPARVPNQVLTAADYAIVMNQSAPMAARKAAFRRRKSWLRSVVTSNRRATLNGMVKRWYKLGFVVAKPGPANGPFPGRFAVEVSRTLAEPRAGAVEPTPILMNPDVEIDG
jgi:L-Lysine epsilon oxidase N-terminal/L-lysine epsilon oxidase C-terminal domain